MMRRPTDETDPADWIEFAAERLKSADLLWRHEELTPSGIECLQEAIERDLKAFYRPHDDDTAKSSLPFRQRPDSESRRDENR